MRENLFNTSHKIISINSNLKLENQQNFNKILQSLKTNHTSDWKLEIKNNLILTRKH